MKPSPFKYVRAETVAEAVGLLREHGDDARILAGGQSLLPMLNMRLADPGLLVDVSRIDDLAGISVTGEHVRVGALTRHADVLGSPEVARHLPLIARAMPYVAHAAVRSQGTFGGSIAHADPAAEIPACAVALGAVLEVVGAAGKRHIGADAFFRGVFETALDADELLAAVQFEKPRAGDWCAFDEVVRRHGDYALAGLAAQGTRTADGVFEKLRLVFFAVSDRPVLATGAAQALVGVRPSAEVIRNAQEALAGDLQPDGDLYASPDMKLHLARVLLGRILGELAAA